MPTKLMLAFAAALSIALAGCGGGVLGAFSGLLDNASQNAAISRYNEAVAAADAAITREHSTGNRAQTLVSAARRNPTSTSIAAARSANAEHLRAAQDALTAIERVRSLEPSVGPPAAYRQRTANNLAIIRTNIETARSRNTVLNNLQARIGGGSGSGSGGSGGGASGNVVVNTTTFTLRHAGFISNPSSAVFRDPHRPSGHPEYATSGSDTGLEGVRDISLIRGKFNRYVISSNRNSNLANDGYRRWFARNGVETFIHTRAPYVSYGRYGGFLAVSGTRHWAQSPRGYNTGTNHEFARETWGRGQYSAFSTAGQFSCRENASITASSGWYWRASYCEGYSYAQAFGDRYNARPSTSGTWRGAMTGDALVSGSSLTGDVTLTYSSASNTVSVAITDIRDRNAGTSNLSYEGPSSFRWSSLNVDNNGSFERDEAESYIGGYFYGPEGQETAGAFSERITECINRDCDEPWDSHVVGAWLGKRQ